MRTIEVDRESGEVNARPITVTVVAPDAGTLHRSSALGVGALYEPIAALVASDRITVTTVVNDADTPPIVLAAVEVDDNQVVTADDDPPIRTTIELKGP